MSHAVRFSARAERHLDAIFGYIEVQSGTERADSFVGSIIDYCRELAIFPQRGTCRDDLASGIRTLGFRRRVTIVLTVELEAVTILGVYYGGQNFEATLSDELVACEERGISSDQASGITEEIEPDDGLEIE